MYQLEEKEYGQIKHLFKDVFNFSWLMEIMEREHLGKVFLSSQSNMETVYIETPFSDFYFGGKYDEIFLNEIMQHIIDDIMSNDEEKIGFFYTTNHEWKKKFDDILVPFIDPEFGNHLIRFYHKLNLDKYNQFKKELKPLSDKYEIKFNPVEEIAVKIYHNNKEICSCEDFGQGDGMMDIDIYVDPDYRRQGLAQISAVKLIEYCLDHNIIPLWGSWNKNIKSCQLARKIGFEVIVEEPVHFANFSNK